MGREGIRSDWNAVPATVRRELDTALGSPVVSTTGLHGGFSPGPAVRATLADGRTVFLKAAGSEINPESPAMHRREGHVLAGLPPSVPAPGLIGVVDDGDWVVLMIEWIEGRMPSAKKPEDVRRLVDLLHRLCEVGPDVEVPGIGQFADEHRYLGNNWTRIAAHPPSGLDEWSLRHLNRLTELEEAVWEATSGTHLVHVDVRTDNVLLADDGPIGDVLVDWPGASLGAPWIDLVGLLPALHLDGGPTPAEVFDSDPIGRTADRDAVDACVVALAGYFTRQSLLPAPPGMPTLRQFQGAQGLITRRWAGERLRLS